MLVIPVPSPAFLSGADRCAAAWEDQRARLAQLAQRALARGLDGRKALIVCIEVYSDWRPIVDQLMPGHDWTAARARGEGMWARGSVMREGFVEPAASMLPGIARELRTRPPRGLFHAVIMVDGHASLYLLEPEKEPS